MEKSFTEQINELENQILQIKTSQDTSADSWKLYRSNEVTPNLPVDNLHEYDVVLAFKTDNATDYIMNVLPVNSVSSGGFNNVWELKPAGLGTENLAKFRVARYAASDPTPTFVAIATQPGVLSIVSTTTVDY